ncbi:MAG TPA: hypothetical protein VFI08_13955 [Spirochaetia bacterium]|nr:hypothetical protein [Spirochaetia bacterium]
MIHRTRVILCAAATAAVLSLFSCASGPQQIPSGLSVAEIFQRAQDASDQNNFTLAMRYYELVPQSYPDDIVHVTWASYEIAFLYHKMGKPREALDRINALLDQYTTNGDKLPPAPKVLAVKLKTRLEATLKSAS